MKRSIFSALLLASSAAGFGIARNQPRGLLQPSMVRDPPAAHCPVDELCGERIRRRG